MERLPGTTIKIRPNIGIKRGRTSDQPHGYIVTANSLETHSPIITVTLKELLIRPLTWEGWRIIEAIVVTLLSLILLCLEAIRLKAELTVTHLQDELHKTRTLEDAQTSDQTPMDRDKYYFFPHTENKGQKHHRHHSASQILFMSSAHQSTDQTARINPDQEQVDNSKSEPQSSRQGEVAQLEVQPGLVPPEKTVLAPPILSRAPSATGSIRIDQPEFIEYRDISGIPSESEDDRESLPLEQPLSPEQVRTTRPTVQLRQSTDQRATEATSQLSHLVPEAAQVTTRQWILLVKLIVLPDPQNHKDKLFDGTEVTQWLKDVNEILHRYRVADQDRIREIPSWTADRDMRKKVETAISDATTWDEAQALLKTEFATRDPNQYRSYKSKLRDLSEGHPIKNPVELTDLIRNYSTIFQDIRTNTTQVVVPDDYVEAILGRIQDSTLKDIIYHANTSLTDIQAASFVRIKDMIYNWANQEVRLSHRHHSQKKSLRFEDQDDDDTPPQTQPERTRRGSPSSSPRPKILNKPEPLTVESLTERFNSMQINMQKVISDQIKQELAAIKDTPAVSPYVMPRDSRAQFPNRPLEINQIMSRRQPQLFNPRTGGYDPVRLPPPFASNYPPNTCWFCGVQGNAYTRHTMPRCPILYAMYVDDFLHYDRNRNIYVMGRPDGQGSIQNSDIPNQVQQAAKRDGQPIGTAICRYIADQNIGGPFAKRKAEYYQRKIALETEDLTASRHDIETQNAVQQHEDMAAAMNASVANQTATNSAQSNTASVMNISVATIGNGSEDVVDDALPIEYGWFPEVVGKDGVARIKGIIEREIDNQFDKATSNINAIKRRKGPDGETIEVEHPDTAEPKKDKSTDQSESDEPILMKVSNMYTSEAAKFWEEKFAENAKKRFDITWDEMIRFMPGFSDLVCQELVKRSLDRRIAPTSTIKISREKAQKDADISVNYVDTFKPQIRLYALSFEEIERLANEQQKEKPGPLLSNNPGAYFRPHLRLTVRVGPHGDESLITGIIDTGAESSIIAQSYVRNHNLPVRRSNLTCKGFGNPIQVPTLGCIEGPMWLAGQNLPLPIYVVEDKYCTSKLIIGLNFIFQSRAKLSVESDETLIGVMAFGSAWIEVPLSLKTPNNRSLEDFVDPHYVQGK
ncbi:hypothetical protein F4815DRAFT_497231 [Daldinia loculata]|nr:hypothetical protein F4815DRAFT_497231 [Daldinia loculata]